MRASNAGRNFERKDYKTHATAFLLTAWYGESQLERQFEWEEETGRQVDLRAEGKATECFKKLVGESILSFS